MTAGIVLKKRIKQLIVVATFSIVSLVLIAVILLHDEERVLITPNSTQTPLLSPSTLTKLRGILQCYDRPLAPEIRQHGSFWTLLNHVPAATKHACHESVTYTTHATYQFLDNVVPLVDRWAGPVSVAVYAPGDDYKRTMDSIAYLRQCTSANVSTFVTFHVYFDMSHMPYKVYTASDAKRRRFPCNLTPPFHRNDSHRSYKKRMHLKYPVNVGRNIARTMAQTHFVLASDIELFPNRDLIAPFLRMIARNAQPLLGRKVFAMPVFEVRRSAQIPDDKNQLLKMLFNFLAIPFHAYVCRTCHQVPGENEWIQTRMAKRMQVAAVGQRNKAFNHWEPIFIGTNAEPLYEERIFWEQRRDKMIQVLMLCILDYEFLVLNNAFLVHKPGVKHVRTSQAKNDEDDQRMKHFENFVLIPEIRKLFGINRNCNYIDTDDDIREGV